ncbi:MAG TPA: hypothetical protein VHB50_02440, partial [Bryobacteraceae bacterium]|nr:hypothetical protein [Bryobacteraceae bacterium]
MWAVPLITALLLTSVFLVYYFVYVTSQREHLANRNFRSLAVLGDQIQASVSSYGSILEFYADLVREHRQKGVRNKGHFEQFLIVRPEDLDKPNREEETRRDYLKFLAPDLDVNETPAAAPRPRFEVQRRNGQWRLILTSEHHNTTTKTSHSESLDYTGSLELDKLMRPFVGSLPFDDILLVSDKGDIIYQEKKAGPQFTTLSALLQAQTDGAAAKPEGNKAEGSKSHESENASGAGKSESIAHNSDETWRSRSMHLTDVTLAGTRYKLFLQPVLVDAFSENSGAQEPAREWVVCGLRSAAALEWEALSISYTAMIWFTVVFFAIAVSGPLLRVLSMNRREHFRLREVVSLGLFLIVLTAVITFSAFQATGIPLSDDTEVQLKWLQNRLSGAVHQDLAEMRQQLIDWCRSEEFRGSQKVRGDAHVAEASEVVRNSPTGGAQSDAVGTPPPPDAYPYASNAFWTDDDGQQIIKWSAGRYVTPMIDMSGQAVYTQPKESYLDGRGPTFYFGSVLPPNKLDYLAVLSINTGDCVRYSGAGTAEDLRDDISGGTAFLSAQPLSLIDPILPSGYGFALIDEKGNVLFHNDKTRNLHENFFEESDWSKYLYAAAYGHAGQASLPVRYKGQSYRASVSSIEGVSRAPWTLIVYRDLTWVRTLNLQATIMASTLLMVFLAGPILWIAIWWAVHRPRHAPEWFWPNARRARTYRLKTAAYTVLTALYLLSGFAGSPEQTFLVSAALPYAILLVTIWCYRASPRLKTGAAKHAGRGALAISAIGVAAILSATRRSGSRIHFPGWWSSGGFVMAATLLERPRRFLVARWAEWQTSAPSEPTTATRGPQTARAWRLHYAGGVLFVIFLAGFLMPAALFRASLTVERRLQLKQAQLHLASALDTRLQRIAKACDDGDLNELACHRLEYAKFADRGQIQPLREPVWNRIVFDPLFPASGKFLFAAHSVNKEAEEPYGSWFESIVYLLHHDYNQAAAEALGVIPDRTGSVKRHEGPGPDWSWESDGSHLTLRFHGFHIPVEPETETEQDLLIRSDLPHSPVSEVTALAGLGVLVMLVMGALVWPLTRRIFLFRIATLRLPLAQQAAEAIRDGRNVVVLTPPVSDWRVEGSKWTLDVATLATDPSWGESFDLEAVPRNCVVELLHFEHMTGDQATDAQKFVLLGRLLNRENTQCVVVMKVPASMDEYRRMFPGLELFDLRDEPFYWLAQCEGPVRDLIWKECRDLPALWPLGARLAKDLEHEDVHSRETIASELLERADPYYRMVWKECSPDQKFVLAQLATDGMLNPANDRAIRQLVRRGLILTTPQFRIVNESFRRFLVSAPTLAERREWRREA